MADNIQLNTNTTSGQVIKTDDDGTAHWQYVKMSYGADGSQTRVTASNGLPVSILAGSASIGTLGANSGVDIGDVDVISVTPGTGASNLGKAEDSAHTTGDVGVMGLGVRKDTATSLAGADGDYTPAIFDSSGRLHVNVGNSVTVSNSGTFVVQEDGAALTALQVIDNIVNVDDSSFTAGSGSGVPMMGFATSDSVDSGDIGAIAMDTSRNLKVSIEVDNAGIGGGTQYAVDTALGATPTGTLSIGIRDDALSTLTPVEGDAVGLRVDANGALWMVHNGDVTISDGGNVISVDDGGSTLSIDDGGGSITIDGTVTSSNTTGNVAHDSADSGNPVKIGAKVETSPKGVTLAADGDRTDLYADSDGLQIVKVGTTGADHVDERVSDTAGTSTAFTNFSAVASTYNYVTAYSIANTSATDGYVDFRDGTGGSVLWTVPIPGNGGANLSNGGSPLFKTSANTALAYDVSAALTTVYISAAGYQSKV